MGISTATAASEQCNISAGWMERPSYQYVAKNGEPEGFDIAYIHALSKELNCSATFKKMPWFRQDKEMVAGRIDLLLGALPSGVTPDLIRVSVSYRQDPIGFYVHKKDVSKTLNKRVIDLLNDGFLLGTISHDTHSPEVLKLKTNERFKGRIFPIHSAKALLRNLKRKMINAIMLHSAEVDYLKQKNSPLVKDIVLIPSLSFTTPAHLIMGKNSPLGADYIKVINEGIKALEDKGITKALVEKHAPSHLLIE